MPRTQAEVIRAVEQLAANHELEIGYVRGQLSDLRAARPRPGA